LDLQLDQDNRDMDATPFAGRDGPVGACVRVPARTCGNLSSAAVEDLTARKLLAGVVRPLSLQLVPDVVLVRGVRAVVDFHVAMCDGSVKRIPKGIDPVVLRYAIDRADCQAIVIEEAIKKAKAKE
jgi:hypothetical protein